MALCLQPLALEAPLLLRALRPLPSAALAVVQVGSKQPPLVVPMLTVRAQVVVAAAVTTLPGLVDPQPKEVTRHGPRVARPALLAAQAVTVVRPVLGKLVAAVVVERVATPAVVKAATAAHTVLVAAVVELSHR